MTFQQVYNEHKNLVYNLALQYLQNIEDAEEIVQDVFVTVHEKMAQFKEQSQLKTWVYRITINKCLDYIKGKRAKKRWGIFTSLSADREENPIQVSDFNHPGIELEQKEALEHIFKCINQLVTHQKTAIILLKIEGLSQVETAEIMNLSPKAVESLFQRAKTNLKNLLHHNMKENERKFV